MVGSAPTVVEFFIYVYFVDMVYDTFSLRYIGTVSTTEKSKYILDFKI